MGVTRYPQAKTEDDIEHLVESLGYDFDQFELDHFLRHIEARRRRELLVIGYPVDPTVHGLWIPVEHADYIFFNNQTPYIHQIHIILHEIGLIASDGDVNGRDGQRKLDGLDSAEPNVLQERRAAREDVD
jgi:hypothetical protein